VSRLRHKLLPILVLLPGLACRAPIYLVRAPGKALRCQDQICSELVYFQSHVQYIGMWIDAPPATRLLNARVTADAAPPCQGQFPVEWVTVDNALYRTGPVDVSGAHGLVLAFPMNTWWGHSGYWGSMFVDVELEVSGAARCLRTRLTAEDGTRAVDL
jgi:hypothetical protein